MLALLALLIALTAGHAGALDLNVDSFVPDADAWLVGTFEMIRSRRMFGAMAYLSLIILFVFWVKSMIEGWANRNFMLIGKSTFLSITVAAIVTTAVAPGNATNTVYRIPVDAWVSVYRMSTKGMAADIKTGITKDTIELAKSMQEFTTNSFMGLGTMSNIVGGSLYGTAVQNGGTTLDTGSTAVKQVWDEQNEFYKTQRQKLETMSWAFQLGYLILMGFFLAFAGVIYLSGASVLLALFMLLPALAFWAGGRGRGLTIVFGSFLGSIATVTILPTIMLVVTSLALSQPTKTLKMAVDTQNLEAQAAVTTYANNMIKCAADAAKEAGKIQKIPIVGGVASQFKVMNRGMCVLSSNAPVVFSEIGRVLMRVIMGLAVMVISMIVGVAIGAAVIRLVPSYIQSVFEGGPTGSDNTSVGSIGRTAFQASAAVGALSAGVAAPLANGAMRAVGGADRGLTAGNQMLGQKMADSRAASAALAGGGMGGAGNGAAPSATTGAAASAAAVMGGAGAGAGSSAAPSASGIAGQAYGAAGGPAAGVASSPSAAGGAQSVAGGSAASVGGNAVAATPAGGAGAVGTAGGSSSQTTPGPQASGPAVSSTSAGGAGSVSGSAGAPGVIANTGSVTSTNRPAPSAVPAGVSAGNTASTGTGASGTTSAGPSTGPVAATSPAGAGAVSSSGSAVGTTAAPANGAPLGAVPAGTAGGAASVGAVSAANTVNTGKAGEGVTPGETNSKAINAAGAGALPGTQNEQQSQKAQKAEKIKEIRAARQARQDAKDPPTATGLLKRDALAAGKAAVGAGAAAGGRVATNASRNVQAAKATAKYNESNPESKMTVPEMRQQMERNGDFDRGRDNAAVRNVTAAHNAAEDRSAAGDPSYVKQPITTDQARETLSRSGNLPHQQAGNAYRNEETRRNHAAAERGRQATDPNHKPSTLSAEQAQALNEQTGNTVQADEAKARS